MGMGKAKDKGKSTTTCKHSTSVSEVCQKCINEAVAKTPRRD